jgi:hypothetical protein
MIQEKGGGGGDMRLLMLLDLDGEKKSLVRAFLVFALMQLANLQGCRH